MLIWVESSISKERKSFQKPLLESSVLQEFSSSQEMESSHVFTDLI